MRRGGKRPGVYVRGVKRDAERARKCLDEPRVVFGFGSTPAVIEVPNVEFNLERTSQRVEGEEKEDRVCAP